MDEQTAEETVLRADFGAYRRWFGKPIHGLPLIVGLIGGGAVSAFDRGDGALLFVLLAGAVAGTLGSIAIHILTSRVVVTHDSIESRRWLRRTRLRLDDGLVGALAELEASPVGRTSQVLVLRARSGGRRIRLNGAYWDHEDLVRIAAVAGVPTVDGVLTPRELDRVAPGTMPWRALHPWAFGFGGALVAMALLIGGVVAWWDAKGLPPFDEQPPRAVSARTIEVQDTLLVELERTMGGEWESPDVHLNTCQDPYDYKGWSREVSVQLRRVVAENAEDEGQVVTPIRPTPELIDAIGRTLSVAGHPELFVDKDELAEFAQSGYLRITSFPDRDDRGPVSVDVTFRGEQGRASMSVDSPCETPPR